MLPWFIALRALGLLATAGAGIYVALNGTPEQVATVLCTALGLSAIAMLGLALNHQ
jgi:hypothetical protein